MEILRFLKWWWINLDFVWKSLSIVLSIEASLIIIGIGFGIKVLLGGLATILFAVFVFLMSLMVKAIRNKYREYKLIREKDADLIVDRLRGRV